MIVDTEGLTEFGRMAVLHDPLARAVATKVTRITIELRLAGTDIDPYERGQA